MKVVGSHGVYIFSKHLLASMILRSFSEIVKPSVMGPWLGDRSYPGQGCLQRRNRYVYGFTNGRYCKPLFKFEKALLRSYFWGWSEVDRLSASQWAMADLWESDKIWSAWIYPQPPNTSKKTPMWSVWEGSPTKSQSIHFTIAWNLNQQTSCLTVMTNSDVYPPWNQPFEHRQAGPKRKFHLPTPTIITGVAVLPTIGRQILQLCILGVAGNCYRYSWDHGEYFPICRFGMLASFLASFASNGLHNWR